MNHIIIPANEMGEYTLTREALQVTWEWAGMNNLFVGKDKIVGIKVTGYHILSFWS